MRFLKLILLLPLVFLASCGERRPLVDEGRGVALNFKYAALLDVADFDGFRRVVVRNPWDSSSVLQTYVLVDRDSALPKDLPQGVVVRTPLSRSVVCAAAHCGLFDELGAYKAVAGVCDLKFINMKRVHDDVAAGRIVSLGDGLNPDVERLVELNPDALFVSPFENGAGGWTERLGVPVVECAEYMERLPLGRAEWMRFYGMLLGCEERADSLFAEVEKRYLQMSKLAGSAAVKPSVVYGLKYGSVWYVPGGRSQTANLLADAGADYVFSDNLQEKTIPLSFETVFEKGGDADFWLFNYHQKTDKTCDELKSDHLAYSKFEAFGTDSILGCNSSRKLYYEETPFHPDLLLDDLVKIFHKDLCEDNDLRYFEIVN